MITKNISSETTWVLRKAFKNKRAPIWKHLENELANSRSHASEVNISKWQVLLKKGKPLLFQVKFLGPEESIINSLYVLFQCLKSC